MSETAKKTVLTLVIAALVSLALFKPMDQLGGEYVDSAFKRALLGFAIARGLNGVISVAQGTEVAVQPAGVGVNFTPGQILDPVNDLVERFSWIMLLASSSLGVQKTLLTISGWIGLGILVAITAAFFLFTQWTQVVASEAVKRFATQVFILLLVLRFIMPLVALANEWFYQQFLAEQYEQSSEQLENVRDKIGEINDEVMQDSEVENSSGALVDRARQLYRSAVKKVDFERRLEDYKAAAQDLSENAINLIVVFLMQTVVLPLLFLWAAITLARRLLR
ncbi:MAG: hypothetical protein ACR2P1_25980 [Pseudomonadales bacterium]